MAHDRSGESSGRRSRGSVETAGASHDFVGVGIANDLCEPEFLGTVTQLVDRGLVQYLTVYEYDNYAPAFSDAVRAALPATLRYVWHGSGDLELPLDRDCISINAERINAVVERWAPMWITEDLIITSFGRRLACGTPNYVPLFLTDESLDVCIRRTSETVDRLGVSVVPEVPHFYGPVPQTMELTEFLCAYCAATGVGINLDVGHLFSYNLMRGRSPTAGLADLPLDHVVEINTAGGMYGDPGHLTWIDDYTAPLNPYVVDVLDDVISDCPNLQGIYTETIWAHPSVVLHNVTVLNELAARHALV